LADRIEQLCKRTRDAWAANPDQIEKDFREEENLLYGGYGNRQVLELVQNAADAAQGRESARCELRIIGNVLYAANEGSVLDAAGARALIMGQLSGKRSSEIGRFGLGFRSLLKFGGVVDFMSGGVVMRFDPERCAAEARLAGNLDDSAPAPGFRLVELLDPGRELECDPMLASMSWADTVVRMRIGDPDSIRMVESAFREFPAPFVLFTDVAMELEMSVDGRAIRSISRERQVDEVVVLDGDTAATWKVFTRLSQIDDKAALADGGSVHARGSVRVSWAVRVNAPEPQTGELWAYFPTRTHSGLPGILNAHWKVNSDRTGLTGQEWNTALMKVAADLVADSLRTMASGVDPALALSLFPELPNRPEDIYSVLSVELWRRLPDLAIIPDANGAPAMPRTLARPRFNDAVAYGRWVRLVDEGQKAWVIHPSCIETVHRQTFLGRAANLLRSEAFMRSRDSGVPSHEKLLFILSLLPAPRMMTDDDVDDSVRFSEFKEGYTPSLCPINFADWLAAAASREPSRCAQLLEVGAIIARRFKSVRESLKDIPLVPASDGTFRAGASLVLMAEDHGSGLRAVDPLLLEDTKSVKLLTDFYGVREIAREVLLPMLRAQWINATPARPEQFWNYHVQLAAAPEDIRVEFLRENRNLVLVKTAAGQWRGHEHVLLAGKIIKSAFDDGAQSICVDPVFAKEFSDTLRLLDIKESPAPNEMVTSHTALIDARDRLYDYYLQHAKANSKPQQATLAFVSGGRRPLIGATMLESLHGETRSRLTELTLRQYVGRVPVESFMGANGSSLTNARYPRVRVPDPSTCLVLAYGTLTVHSTNIYAETVLWLSRQLGPTSRAVLGILHDKVEPLDQRVPVGYPLVIPDIQSCWDALAMSSRKRSSQQRLELWEAGAILQLAPSVVPFGPKNEVASMQTLWITRDRRVADLAARAGKHAELVGPLAHELWQCNGATVTETLLRCEIGGQRSEHLMLSELVAGTELHTKDGSGKCALVESIQLRLDLTVQEIDVALDGDTLFIRRDWWQGAARADATVRVLEQAQIAGWLTHDLAAVMRSVSKGGETARRLRVSDEVGLAAKLLRAVGGRTTPLRDVLPLNVRDLLPERLSGKKLAQVVLDVFGSSSLRKLLETLRAEQLAPPGKWGGGEATAFVRHLGFPDAFAGAANPRPTLELVVHGPPALGPLHEYQMAALTEVRQILDSHEDRRRLVLSLPTGAGKTRVAVEAVVRQLQSEEKTAGATIWLAQTQELAEQAVEAFRAVWRAKGMPDAELRLIQFWGSAINPTESRQPMPTVIVSLVQTLERRMSDPAIGWINTPSMVVIDESHHAIAPVYTQILEFFGFATGNRKARTSREPALLGLSATPFRSAGVVESKRLAARFDSRVTPADQEELFAYLQREGFLSQVTVHEVNSEEELNLTREEREQAERFGELPESAIERLARNTNRNERILSLIQKAPERSVLLFAATVAHAEILATMLSLSGVRSRVVSGETDRSARQHAIEEFRSGEVRVLCNAQVLTTGFDAPKVDLIVIARPVYSPVRYMQMVGRGMRGPQNGGTSSCRVLTITDVVHGFSAFNSIEWWRQYYQ